MNKIGTDIISFSVLLIGAIVMLCSCHDDSYPVPSSETEGMRRNLVISLTVQQPGLQSPTSRAPFDTGYELGFTEKECQIHTLTLIMMGVYNGEELFETWQTIEPSEPTNGIYDVQFTLSGITGTKHFYILANAEQKHINAFWAKDRIFDAGEGQSGHNIVGNLMEINHNENENGDGEGSNILMAGIVKSNSGDRDIVIPTGDGNEDTDEKITIDTSADLVRTVAKVLLTCMPSKKSNNHVAVIDAKDKDNDNNTTDNTGWIQLADVNYMLNVLNRKTYLDYREDTKDDDYLIDPNYEMSEWLGKKVSGDETTYGIKDLDAYQKEFLYYDTQAMVEMLNKSIPTTYQGGEPCMVRTATLYEDKRIGETNATNPAHYTEGLYCTENTVYNDMKFDKDADFQSAIRYVTTRVMIGAKYTPKKIWYGEDAPVQASTEAEAQQILKEVTDYENPLEPVTYLAGTFWRDSQGNYYSLAGMKKKLKESPETDFSRYDGGWGYYYTYIDENAQNGAIKDTQTRWGIKRNHYYILKVEKIIAPGSPFPGNETMRIHSELVDWIDKGGSEEEIKVPQQSETAQP